MIGYIEKLLGFIVDTINSMGYFGIYAGMLLESACIPLPSEVVLPIAGGMVSKGTISLLGANVAVALGSLTGSLIAYAVGHYGGRPFILKYGKYFFVSAEHFYTAERTFNKYGVVAVFFGRLLPIVRTFISLPAGIARMDLKKFVLYSLLGMVPWNFLLIYLGYVFGEKYAQVIRPIFHKFEYVVIAALALGVLFVIFRFKFKKAK
ncbi:MAG: DedA family protein [Clostridiales bacterium]|jgi:membrane protein DedA with SNARE-associated domain|nr:DedA family protein [Eubacteriales bacterium]MDH7565121.1 DedA family protein [Clostridiales bacterium]